MRPLKKIFQEEAAKYAIENKAATRQQTKVVRLSAARRWFRRYPIAVAASVLLLIVAGLGFRANMTYSSSAIITELHDPLLKNIAMGDIEQETAFRDGKAAWFEKAYERAIELLQSVKPENENYYEAQV